MFRRMLSLLLALLLPFTQFAVVGTCRGGSTCAIQDSRPHIHVGGCRHCHVQHAAPADDSHVVAASQTDRETVRLEGPTLRPDSHPDHDVVYVSADGLYAVRRQAGRVLPLVTCLGEMCVVPLPLQPDAVSRGEFPHARVTDDRLGVVPLYVWHCAFLI